LVAAIALRLHLAEGAVSIPDNGDGEDLFDDLHGWITEDAVWFLRNLHALYPNRESSKDILRDYLSSGDLGSWVAIAYKNCLQRSLDEDREAVLRDYIAALRRDPSRRLEWLPPGAESSWRPVTDDSFSRVEPNDLQPALSLVNFGGKRHRVRVFRQKGDTASMAQKATVGIEGVLGEASQLRQADAHNGTLRTRGPRPDKREKTAAKMKHEIDKGELTRENLADMREKELEARYGVSRDTARRARNKVLERA
jgi:hypothetical protein